MEDLAYEIFCPKLHRAKFFSLGFCLTWVRGGLPDAASFEPTIQGSLGFSNLAWSTRTAPPVFKVLA